MTTQEEVDILKTQVKELQTKLKSIMDSLISPHPVNYYEYINSFQWKLKRQKVIDRCNNVCEECHQQKVDHVHHLTYDRVGHELLEDLLGLCKKCHEDKHPDKVDNESSSIITEDCQKTSLGMTTKTKIYSDLLSHPYRTVYNFTKCYWEILENGTVIAIYHPPHSIIKHPDNSSIPEFFEDTFELAIQKMKTINLFSAIQTILP